MNKIFCTIDLEDFSYDYPRTLGLKLKKEINFSALLKNYNQINQLCKKNDIKITFFCTGILGKLFPDIIKLISSDGHEIASQYFYHDYANKDDLKTFEKRIYDSINILSNSSKNKICGFRAPYFSLNYKDIKYYQILEKYFEYDSSLLIDVNNYRNKIGTLKSKLLGKLNIYPVLYYSPFPKVKLRLGGTYFKILPLKILNNLSNKILNYDNCIVYLHPYDYDTEFSYINKFKTFDELNSFKQMYFYLKQFQWLYFGNNNVLNKLTSLMKLYPFEKLLKDMKN